jgi:CheY-like chemotaxis protein
MSGPLPKPLILVVEDDSDLRTALDDLLRDEGYDVLTASHGEEGLSLLREHPHVRAIVLDVAMPVMNGATFRGEQLADERIASVPLILLSGRDDIAPLASALGAAVCIRKPLASEALLEALARYR